MYQLTNYNGIPHLLAPVVTDPKKAAAVLQEVVAEMERRYDLFAGANVRNIELSPLEKIACLLYQVIFQLLMYLKLS